MSNIIPNPENLRITKHALERLDERKITRAQLFEALRHPEATYPHRHNNNQIKVVSGYITIVVDLVNLSIPTILYNKANDEWEKHADHRFA